METCTVCNARRAKRACPGLGQGICAACCGTGREVTIDCPLDCPFLIDARLHERPAAVDPESIPNRDVEVSEDFIRHQEHLVLWFCHSLARAMEKGKAVDFDAREGLEAVIQSLRTQLSGLIYESRPTNPYAADIQEALKAAIEDLRKAVAEESGMAAVRDADLIGTLVFIQRLELQHSNGRRRGRAFYDFLLSHFPAQPSADVAQALSLGGPSAPAAS